jgi:uncharacterized protein YndB with AHSA1/START domain
MKEKLMHFTIDKDNNRIIIEREFASPLANVWKAWTVTEILDKWWAPKPWRSKTLVREFKVGGYWLYAMLGPEGEEVYGRADYLSIREYKGFSARDGFSDSEGNINRDLPQNKWETTFTSRAETTIVKMELSFDSEEDLDKIIEMGFKEGFSSSLENLDEVLENSD